MRTDCNRNRFLRGLVVVLVSVAAAVAAASASAQESVSAAPSADQVARELSNPVGSLASLVLQGNYAKLGGSAPGVSDQSSTSLVFLPTLPFTLGSGNLTLRPSFPVVGAPVPAPNGGWDKVRGFGDIVLLGLWGRKEESGLLWGAGATTVFPTASEEATGSDQWQLGPAALVGFLKQWGVVGALWQHWYGLNSDPGEEKISKGTLQLFYWFSLAGGWQVGGSPIPTANYLGATTEFSVPINLGVAKTFVLGSTPLKTTLQGQYFLTRPDVVGPDWGFFFQITPVVKMPW
jgi:hypothetical protein